MHLQWHGVTRTSRYRRDKHPENLHEQLAPLFSRLFHPFFVDVAFDVDKEKYTPRFPAGWARDLRHVQPMEASGPHRRARRIILTGSINDVLSPGPLPVPSLGKIE